MIEGYVSGGNLKNALFTIIYTLNVETPERHFFGNFLKTSDSVDVCRLPHEVAPHYEKLLSYCFVFRGVDGEGHLACALKILVT